MAEDRRFREVQRYADVHGFFGGFPNFHEADYGDGVVYGTIFLRDTEAEWRDVPRSEYQIFHIEDVPGLFRAANDYAGRAGFPAAFPNCEQADHGQGVVYGTILMKPGTTEWRDVLRSDLGNPRIDDVPAMMRAANDYSARNGFAAGFPTFHQADHGQGVVYGIVLLNPGVSTWRDIPADLLAKYSAPPRRWAILLCNLNDRPPSATSRDRYVQFFTESGAGLGTAFDYWHDMSYGTEGLRDTGVFGFFQMPHSSAELLAITGSAQRSQAFAWGLDAARGANVRLNDYEHKIVLLNGGGTDHGATGGGVTFEYADGTPLEPTFMCHEMGHEFGLDHSFGEQAAPCATGDNRPGAYCDRPDIMSAMNVASFQDAMNRRSGPSLNAMSRKRLGWLHGSRIRSLPAGGPAETITLVALNRPDVEGYQMVEFVGTSRVNSNAISVYTVEFRERSGWDQGLNSSAVIIHEIRSDGLIRLLTNNPMGTVGAGGEFVSPSPSTVVRVESVDATSHTARLRIFVIPSDSHVFDAEFYLHHYPDLVAAFGTDLVAARNHWINQGLPNEGRRGSREFDVRFYLGHYGDLKNTFGTNYSAAIDHWLNQGLPIEGRRGSREFDVQFYLGHYGDLKNAFGTNYSAAIDHWLNQGLPNEGRRGSREFDRSEEHTS